MYLLCTPLSHTVQDEVRVMGMMKLHTDCFLGKPGPGRVAAVAPKTPLQLARLAPEFLAVRVNVSTGGQPAVFTFFMSRNAELFPDIQRLKASAHGARPVTVPYDAVANAHLTTTKRNVAPGAVDVVDVAGNFTSARDQITVDGDVVSAVLTRVEAGVRMDLRVSILHQREDRVLTFRGGCVVYEELPCDRRASGVRLSGVSLASVSSGASTAALLPPIADDEADVAEPAAAKTAQATAGLTDPTGGGDTAGSGVGGKAAGGGAEDKAVSGGVVDAGVAEVLGDVADAAGKDGDQR